MPRGIPNVKTAQTTFEAPAPQLQAPKAAPRAEPGLETRLARTALHHIYNFDIKGDGRRREVAVIKMAKLPDGRVQSVWYIDVQLLDNVDKGRIKNTVMNIHADKYELWDLLSQITLNNGKNGLDYFHQLVRVEHGHGAVNTQMGGGLMDIRAEGNQMIGAGFTDPGSATINSQEA